MDYNRYIEQRPFRNSGFSLPRLGFGVMRLPLIEGKIDYSTAETMIDRAMECGCNYFDTAYMYHNGESEKFLGRVLAKFPRKSFFLTDKMPIANMKSADDNERIFNEQLDRTKAGYFDFYFLHWLNIEHWKMAKEFKTLEFIKEKQKQGKIRRIGFSFHGEPEMLSEIADAFPWDMVQIQLNYLDWIHYRSKEQYEVLTKRNIPVAVMEPLKGGMLLKVSQDTQKIFHDANPQASIASWGLRFVASLPNVQVVLSGMSSLRQLEDNINTFSPFTPLSETEQKVISSALATHQKGSSIPCTGCRYCMPCPAGVDIPRNIALYNQAQWRQRPDSVKALVYSNMSSEQRASSCIGCGQCKQKCPQRIDIPNAMKKIISEFK